MNNKLEKDFKQVEDEIRIKMEAAAVLIKEATSIAENSGLKVKNYFSNEQDNLYLTDYSLSSAVYPLMDALEDAGWMTSSLTC